MTLTATTAKAAAPRLELSAGTIVEGEDKRTDDVASLEYGIYRATKNRRLIDECAEVLNRGGVAALVPTTATETYLKSVAEQVEQFARSRHQAEGTASGGILALPTSGSTGTPKLVAIPVAGLVQFLQWGQDYFNFDATTLSLSLSPWNFDVSLLDTWAVLSSGGTVVAAEAARLHDAAYLARLLDEHRPTFVQVVPSTLDALINAAGGATYPSIRNVVLTGGVVAQPARAAAAKLFPEATFHNVYGATEVNDCLIETLSAQQFAGTETLPLGMPIAGCEIYLDADGERQPLHEAAEATHGELLVRTPWMADGYIHEGSMTPLPVTADALYPMKDQALWANGQLMYQGRRDRVVKVRGQRVNLEELENAARRTGLVGMACAWLTDTAPAEELHMAYTTPDHGTATTGLQLRMAMSATLPAFAMPNHLHAFAGPFPLNGNGKPDLPTIKSRVESE
ncbi:AMP-binding protein [Brevibacterium sp. XM4083]|uniref:AMP-binding protein n=1 Tax=Brevibacterium sp. XM4083 TaxID=2583238 RepID=UPI0015E82165|nr:AMP-binding protein [Brevibacterium sp. XM4083]MCM1011805.1 AMP-binding protein [Brevibacterium sp. XM4083]